MRTSVLGLWDFDDPQRIVENTETVCKITHYDPRCVASCVAVSMLVNQLAKGRAPDDTLLQEVRATATQYDGRLDAVFEASVAHEDIDALDLDEEEGIGYTLKPLAAGLWALVHAESLEEGLLRVIQEGGDADSNASVAGALLGARYGIGAIPAHLVQGLNRKRYLSRVGSELLNAIRPRPVVAG